MSTLSPDSIRIAVRHLVKYGDTDLFPHLPEIAFLRDDEDAVVSTLSKLEPGVYSAKTAINSLAPKGRLGFRSAHQLGITDNVLLLASVIEIGADIEGLRLPIGAGIAFSYRFHPEKTGDIFVPNRSYRDWMMGQKNFLKQNQDAKVVLYTDISDFYQRIYTHRIEGFLGDIKSTSPAAAFITKVIKAIRGKESFGLPVGGAASRLLAELALRDVDRNLFDEGVTFTRYVDDFRIFLKSESEVYDTLAFLAEALLAEGLTLNSAKTRVRFTSDYLNELEEGTVDLFSASQEQAIAALTASLYVEEQPTPGDVAALQSINLVELLKIELLADEIDFAKVRKILRGIRVVSPASSLKLILEHFYDLLPMAKEVTLILEEVAKVDKNTEVAGLKALFVKAYNEPPARNISIIRAWLMEAFIRNVFPLEISDLKSLSNTSSALDVRQNYLLQGKLDRRTFFRNKKYELDSISVTNRFSFLMGATCLPKEELKVLLDTVKKTTPDPLISPFCNWLLKQHGSLLN
jgi:hypothetical protein